MEEREKRLGLVRRNRQSSQLVGDVKVGLIIGLAYVALFGSIVAVGIVYGWLWGAILGLCLLALAGSVVLRFRSWW